MSDTDNKERALNSLNLIQERAITSAQWNEILDASFPHGLRAHVELIEDALSVALRGVYSINILSLSPSGVEYYQNGDIFSRLYISYSSIRALLINASLENVDYAAWELVDKSLTH